MSPGAQGDGSLLSPCDSHVTSGLPQPEAQARLKINGGHADVQ